MSALGAGAARPWAGARRALAAAAVLAVLGVPGAARGQSAEAPISVHVTLEPAKARLGEPVRYQGRALLRPGASGFRWVPPGSGGDLVWGTPRTALARGAPGAPDTLAIEVPLQVFRLGRVEVPGLWIAGADTTLPPAWHLPSVTLEVAPVVPAADSTADLRPPRGPLAAPWWERVPWRIVALVAAAVAAVVAIVVLLLRRRRRGVIEAPPAVSAADPFADALARLEALRARDLPGRGELAEHAFELSQILHRLLEDTEGTPRPGDTTTELLRRIADAGIAAEDRGLLADLLRGWDRVKFARVPSNAEEARRGEGAVEAFVRRRASARAERAA